MINAVAVAGILTLFQVAPTRVEVTPERSEIEVQATAQLTVRAFDGSGRAINGFHRHPNSLQLIKWVEFSR